MIVQSKTLRLFLLSLGMVSLILGIIGIFLPLLPTTPFLILSSWCFVRSSEKFHHWLYNHKHLGPSIKAWEEKGAINPKAKVVAIGLISLSITLILLKENLARFHIPLVVILALASLFILSRPNR